MVYSNSPHQQDQDVSLANDGLFYHHPDAEGLSSSSMRKSPNNRRNTVSSFPCTDEWCDPTEKELRRQSMNSFLIQSRPKSQEQREKESNISFCHLSRQELIERVVQLEREKQLNSKLSGKQTNKDFLLWFF
jgi:hypothetical protein